MKRPRPLYRAEQLPLFQNQVFASEEAARNCPTGDVALVQDPNTGLIFNAAFQPELLQYGADYQNEQGHSAIFRGHLHTVAELVREHFGDAPLIEVGCGKGFFLELLQARGVHITGLDPTYEGANPAIIKQNFNAATGLCAEGIVLRHVLEHVKDPVAFLASIRDANGGRGKIYIEVPCFDWICRRRAWFDIFYEHVNYFQMSDFYRMFGTVHDGGHLFDGQYLYVVAELATLRVPKYDGVEPFAFPARFLEGIARCADSLRARGGESAAVWGGSSKGVIFALFMEREGVHVDMVVDINPAKQGKHLPVTGIQVHSPAAAMAALAPGARMLVMNGNYAEEIRALTDDRFAYVVVDDQQP